MKRKEGKRGEERGMRREERVKEYFQYTTRWLPSSQHLSRRHHTLPQI